MNAKSIGKKLISAIVGKNRTMLAAAIGAVVIGLGILIALTISVNSTNHSLPENRDIFTLYNAYNMTVVVVFDEEPPIVQFISPDGNSVDMDNIR